MVVRDDSGAARLEVHPLQLRARRVVSRTGEPLLTSRYINVSKVTTLRHLLQSLRKLYYVSEHAEVRLWHCAPQKLEAWKDQVHDSRARGDGRNPASLNVRTLSREDSFKRSSLDAAVGDAKDAAMAGPSGNAVEGGDTRLSVQNVDTVLAGAESPEAVESPSVAPKSRAESSYWTPSLRSKPLTPNQIIDRWPWEVAHDDEMEDYLGGRLEFVDGQEVMLEIKNGGVWPRSREYEKRYGSADSLGAAASAVKGPETDPAKHQAVATKSAAPQPPKAGEVGLLNLGNTCYFNTAIQCLSHTAFLRGYLLSDVYRYDINTGKEHMGLSGVVAVSFVRLLRQLWHQDGGGVLWKVVEPRHLKDVISKYNEQFRGYQQQDTQEVLSLLLGGLHEDLNRVRKKPFIEQPDSNRRKDEVVADEWWKNGLRRDWSIVTSTFSGQFKSCLYCPTCGHESARFETFTFLQLPLPEPKDRFITVTIFRRENYDIPLRVCAKVAETGTVKDLLKAIEGMAIATETADGFVAPKRRFSLPSSLTPGRKRDVQPIIRAEDLCLVEINPRGYVNRFVDASRPVRQIGATEMLYAYHMPRDPSPPELAPRSIFRSPRAKPAAQGKPVLNGDVLLTCVMRKRVFATYYFLQMFRPALSGAPFLLRTRPGITGEELYKTIFRYLRRYRNWVREPALPPSKASADDTDSFDGKSTTEEVHPDDMGFSLFYVARMGIGKRRPSKGEWFAGPRSDLIQPDDRPVVFDDIDNTIAVDFDDWSFLSGPDAARPQFEYSPLVSWKHRNHESVDDALQEQSKPVSLHSCLEHFCETEELQCFCSKCTRDAKGEYTERLQRKTLNLWAVPPVLIVHLKRFKQNARSSYKLQTDVSFPLDGLDLSMFLGGKPSDEPCSSAGFGEGEEEEAEEEENDAGDLPPLAQAEVSALPVAEVTGRENGETATPTGPEGEPGEAAREDQGDKEDAEEAEGEGQETPEDAVPVDDIPRSCSRANAMYDLYAVINHVGIMGAGHYFTHVKKDGTWLCFNDRRVSVVDADSIDSKAAYLLFYVRRDVAPFVAEENGFEHIFPSGPPSTGAADSAASEEAALEPERAQRSMKALHHAAKSVTDPLSSSSSRVLPEKAESKTPAATAKANAGQEELAAQDSKAADVLNYSDSEHASSEATREEAGVLLPLEGANLVEDSVGVVKPYPWTLSDTPVDEKMVLAQPFLRKLSGKSTSEWAWSQCSIS
uniref:USP domain-containing protein n=1 Tax=Pinguiococcus pyrenoidosus TaxID=172671 RepID=A0A7R9UAR4_9STRA